MATPLPWQSQQRASSIGKMFLLYSRSFGISAGVAAGGAAGATAGVVLGGAVAGGVVGGVACIAVMASMGLNMKSA